MPAPESRRIGDVDMADPDGEWRAHRTVWFGIAAIVIGAAFGIFGEGIATGTTSVLRDGSVASFSRVLRLTNDFDVLLTAVPVASGRCQVAVDSFADWYDIVRIAPSSAQHRNVSNEQPAAVFPSGQATCTIRLTMRARSVGRHSVNLRDTRGHATGLEFTVLP